MEPIFYISEKINPLQSVIVLAAAIVISYFFGLSKKRVIKKFIIAVAAVSLFLAFYLNIHIFFSSGGFTNNSLTFGILQVIEIGLIIFSTLNLLLFISMHKMDNNRFIIILIMLLFSSICAVLVVVADNFILMFTSLNIFVLTIFQLTTSLNLGAGRIGSYMLRYFLRPTLALVLLFFGFSIFYGSVDSKGFSQILEYESISNPLVVISLIVFGTSIYLYFFLFPFQNPYLGLLKRNNASSNAVIWFLYFPVGFFIYLKFNELFGFFIEKAGLYMPIILITLAFICMFAGNLGAVGTASARRIMSFLFLYFIGIFLLNISMFSAGIISMLSMKWLNIACVFLLMFSFIPIYSVFSRIEKNTGTDSIAGIRGLGRSNVYISINLSIIFLSWSVAVLYILPFREYITGGMELSGMGTINIILVAVIALTFIFLMVNVLRIISSFFRKPIGGTTEKIRFPRFYYIYITFFTLVILIVTARCLLEISGIDAGIIDFKVTGVTF